MGSWPHGSLLQRETGHSVHAENNGNAAPIHVTSGMCPSTHGDTPASFSADMSLSYCSPYRRQIVRLPGGLMRSSLAKPTLAHRLLLWFRKFLWEELHPVLLTRVRHSRNVTADGC